MMVMNLKRNILVVLVGLVSGAALAQTDSPNALIEETANLLDERLAECRADYENDSRALYAFIDEILLPRFDRRYSAQLVLGRHWKTATDEQRAAFIDAFYGHLLRKYADGVLQFDMSKIDILPFRGDDTKKRTMVKTTVRLDDGTKVPVNYGLVKREQGWLMFDVVIEGISYVRNFRAELNSEIQKKSIDAVIERLNAEATVQDSGAASADAGGHSTACQSSEKAA